MASNERYPLPRELDSDEQAALLYSPFREKSLNPQSWLRKLKFWENVLSQTALERRTVTFDVNILATKFDRNGMKPKCLGIVVEEMKKSGKIKPLEDYKRGQSWLSWGFSTLVKRPLVWGVSHLLSSASQDSGVYVWPEVVKKLGEEVLELYHASIESSSAQGLVSMTHLRSQCLSLIPSDQDFDIIVTQLERDKKIVLKETQDKETVVKLCQKGKLFVSPIQDVDLHIYRIQAAVKELEQEIELLSSRAEGEMSDARAHLKSDRKTMAKICLRKKRAIVKMIDQRSGSLYNLHDILQTIEAASTNELVVQACQAGLAAMKIIGHDLTLEKVESTMDNIKEAIENQDDINQTLSSGLSPDDSEELEMDLEELLRESVTTRHNKDDRMHEEYDLPDVPTHSPSSLSQTRKEQAPSSTQLLPS